MTLVKDPKDYLEVSLREFFENDENKTINSSQRSDEPPNSRLVRF